MDLSQHKWGNHIDSKHTPRSVLTLGSHRVVFIVIGKRINSNRCRVLLRSFDSFVRDARSVLQLDPAVHSPKEGKHKETYNILYNIDVFKHYYLRDSNLFQPKGMYSCEPHTCIIGYHTGCVELTHAMCKSMVAMCNLAKDLVSRHQPSAISSS